MKKPANYISVEIINEKLRKHLNNSYFKEIQVPNKINEAKQLKKERKILVDKIYNSFWKTICIKFQYEYKKKHSDIIIKRKDVDDINFLACKFYLDDTLLEELKRFKRKNDKLRTVKIVESNKQYKLEFLKYFKDIF